MINCRDIDSVKKMVNLGYSIDSTDNYGQTLLHKAVVYNNYDFVKDIIELGANGRLKDIKGQTPIFYINFKNKNTKNKNKNTNKNTTNNINSILGSDLFKIFLEKFGPIILTDLDINNNNVLAYIT